MRIYSVGHACIHINTNDANIIVDPWIVGSSYGGNHVVYPPRILKENDLRKLTHIIFSHPHEDHFHDESINLIIKNVEKTPKIIIPDYKKKWWKNYFIRKGFHDVFELEHDQVFQINQKIKIHCYINQNGDEDSSFIIEDQFSKIFLQTDNVIDDNTLDLIANQHSKIDHAFLLGGLQGPWPTFFEYTNNEIQELITFKKNMALNLVEKVINKIKPRVVTPYAHDQFYIGENFYQNILTRVPKSEWIECLEAKCKDVQFRVIENGTDFNVKDYDDNMIKFGKKERYGIVDAALYYQNNIRLFTKYINEWDEYKYNKTEVLNYFLKVMAAALEDWKGANYIAVFEVYDGRSVQYLEIGIDGSKVVKGITEKKVVHNLSITLPYSSVYKLVTNQYPMGFSTFNSGSIILKRPNKFITEDEKKFLSLVKACKFNIKNDRY